jgi:hypothetical protein
MSTRRKQCPKRLHDWRMVRGGLREECKNCGTSFPCTTECEHLDCRDARVEAPTNPQWNEAY